MKPFRWALAAGATAVLAAAMVLGARYWQRSSQLSEVRLALRSAEPDVALKRAEPLEAYARQSAEASFLLSIANRRAGHTLKAREFLADARRLGWSAHDIKREELLLEFQSGETESTADHLLALVGDNCPNEEATEIYECMAMGYLSALRIGEARMCLDFWLAWEPESIVAHLLLGQIFHTTRDRLREVAAYEAILKVDPQHVRARRLLADAYLEVKDIAGALKNYEECARLAPDDKSFLVSQATCQRRLGNDALARELLAEAQQGELSDVARSLALTELGQLAINDKQYEQAADYLREATKLAPVNSPAHYALGLALSRVGRQDEADDEFEQSQKMDAEAIRYIDLVNEIMQDAENPDLRCQAGEMALDAGARKEAFAWFESALRCDDSHAATHKALARYYDEAGHKELAARHLARVDNAGGPPASGVTQ